jgi:RNase P subunit RPR2
MALNDPRLEFLKEAAQLLYVTSPASSATLGAARNKLLEERNIDIEAPAKEWNALRREVCGACGNLMLPGWTCEVTRELRPRGSMERTKEEAFKTSRKEKDLVYSCLRCHRRTVQPLPLAPVRRSRKEKRSIKVQKTDPAVNASNLADKNKEVKSANASSKQRAKARKGGLQAMLAKSKTQTSKGLDLMDFMQ